MTDIMGSITYCTTHQDVHAWRSPGYEAHLLSSEEREPWGWGGSEVQALLMNSKN